MKVKEYPLQLILIAVALLAASCNTPSSQSKITEPQQVNLTAKVVIRNLEIPVEIVQTEQAREQGLSGRASLPANQGMLFVFEKSGIYTFWMKDMKFQLDIIWINNGQIVEIASNLPAPKSGEQPQSYTPRAQADYVLELNAGFPEKQGWKIGDLVKIEK